MDRCLFVSVNPCYARHVREKQLGSCLPTLVFLRLLSSDSKCRAYLPQENNKAAQRGATLTFNAPRLWPKFACRSAGDALCPWRPTAGAPLPRPRPATSSSAPEREEKGRTGRPAATRGCTLRVSARSARLRATRVRAPGVLRARLTCCTSCASDLMHLVLSNTFLGVRHLVPGWFLCARSQSAGPRALRLVADQYRHLNVCVKLFHARLVRELVTQSAPCVFNKFVCVF